MTPHKVRLRSRAANGGLQSSASRNVAEMNWDLPLETTGIDDLWPQLVGQARLPQKIVCRLWT